LISFSNLLDDDSDVLIWVLWSLDAALIPLVEFREPEVVRKYEIDLDPEVLDLLDIVTRQKQVPFSIK
jgi:hypothetical protein